MMLEPANPQSLHSQSRPTHRYKLHGLVVSSQIVLPELVAERSGSAIDISIRLGRVPTSFPRAVNRTADIETDENGALLFTRTGTGRYLVTAGREIIVDVDLNAEWDEVRAFLLGTVWAVCCHQRGLLLLHASVVRIAGVAVAFVGPKRAGKSMLASLLALRGHELATDDTCVIVQESALTARGISGYQRLKLWEDTLDALDIDASETSPTATQPGKFIVPLREARWCAESFELHHVVQLADDRQGERIGFEDVTGLQAVHVLTNNTFRPGLVRLLNKQTENFTACAALVRSVRVHRWVRPWGLNRRDEMAMMLEQWVDTYQEAARHAVA